MVAGGPDVAAVADAFLRAIEEDDMAAVGALYAPELRVWHSYDGLVQGKADNIATLSGIAKLGSARYHLLERLVVGDRLVQRHRLVITPHHGSDAFTLDAALFLTIRDGLIVALDEFLDSAPVARVVRAIEAASA